METLIMNLYRNINRSEIQFDFAVHGNRNGDFEKEIFEMGGRFYQFPHMRKDPVAYRKAWRSFWREHNEDYRAFHMHTNSLANIIALEEAARADIPIRIIHSHSSFANRGKLQWLNNYLHKRHRKKVANIATNLIACSDKAAEWMFGGMQLGDKKVLILKNGVDIDKYKFDEQKRALIRKELKVSRNQILIGQIGSFLPVKNHLFSIEIAKELKALNMNFRMIFAGTGPMKDKIEANIVANNLEDCMSLIGVRSDIDSLLSALDVLVMPSLYEGLPVSLIEAQVNGVPIIASESITRNVRINSNLCFLSIDHSANEWAHHIRDLESYCHCANIDKIIAAGYDIVQSSKAYEKILGIYCY